jgi:hypothetical protein
VYDEKTVGCQITEAHYRIHRDKYFERGQSCKFAIAAARPAALVLSASRRAASEYDFAGGIRGEPWGGRRGRTPVSFLPDAEIVLKATPSRPRHLRGRSANMGYYPTTRVPLLYIDVKTVLTARSDSSPARRSTSRWTRLAPGDKPARLILAARGGLPEILGGTSLGGPATRLPRSNRQLPRPRAQRSTSPVPAGAYNGKWTVVVTRTSTAPIGSGPSGRCTRFDPMTDIDTIQRAWFLARPDVFAGELQQPDSDRRLHPVREKASCLTVVDEPGAQRSSRRSSARSSRSGAVRTRVATGEPN